MARSFWAAHHRAYELAASREVSIERLLNTANYLENQSGGYDQFYGRSWLLFHYLTFEKSRQDQIKQFQRLMAEGATDIEAAREAFGDLDELDRDLDRYVARKKLAALFLPPDRLKTSPVTIRKLGDGEAAMMSVIMESRTGVDEEEAIEVITKARNIATKYPDDAAVQEALAEAEFDAGYDSEAIAAADRALATNHPIPLMEFYRAYRSAGQTPPDIAIQGLQRALELAPFDQGLRLTVAAQHMEDTEYQTAAAILRPLAYHPHRSAASEAAEQLLKLAETKEAASSDPAADRPAVDASGTE